jgi:hypothetical protein
VVKYPVDLVQYKEQIRYIGFVPCQEIVKARIVEFLCDRDGLELSVSRRSFIIGKYWASIIPDSLDEFDGHLDMGKLNEGLFVSLNLMACGKAIVWDTIESLLTSMLLERDYK